MLHRAAVHALSVCPCRAFKLFSLPVCFGIKTRCTLTQTQRTQAQRNTNVHASTYTQGGEGHVRGGDPCLSPAGWGGGRGYQLPYKLRIAEEQEEMLVEEMQQVGRVGGQG